MNNLNKRCLLTTLCVASAVIATGCSKDNQKAVAPAVAEAPPVSTESLIEQVGVEPGAIERSGGPAAIIAGSDGSMEVKRLGEESFAAVRNGVLYPGDQVRVGDEGRATILFVDQSTAEIAELSTVAIGSRVATADPASTAAVLSGVARFTAAPRSPGEGPFMVFTPGGVVATKGTVFGVGVAATGESRVGVESGAVEVAGSAALDAPIELGADAVVAIAATGKLEAKKPWPEDDWGVWRDRVESDLDVAATASLHGGAMTTLAAELTESYDALATLGRQVAAFEAQAALAASGEDTAAYQAGLPKGEAAIEASFLSGLRLEWLTHAYASRAALTADLHVRHPELVVWANVGPRVDAAVLWPKRFDATAVAFFEPLRLQYYVHHARGRAHAPFVGVSIPAFFAEVTPPALPPGQLELRFKAFVPPVPSFKGNAHPVWIAAPNAGWHAQAKAHVAPPRGQVAFWMRPAKLKAKATLGAQVKAKLPTRFDVHAPSPHARLKGKWDFTLGEKVAVAPPDLGAAAIARSSFAVGGGIPDLTVGAHMDERAAAHGLHANVNADVNAKVKLKGPELRAQLRAEAKLKAAAREKARAEARLAAAQRTSADVASKARASASGGVKVKLKVPQVSAPKVSGSAKAESRGTKGGASAKGSAKLTLGL